MRLLRGLLLLSLVSACALACSSADTTVGDAVGDTPYARARTASPRVLRRAEPPRVVKLTVPDADPRPRPGETPPSELDPKLESLRSGVLVGLVGWLLKEEHLRARPIDDQLSREAFDLFLESLDPDKLLLVREDVSELQMYRDRVDDQFESGEVELIDLATKLVAERIDTISEMIPAVLSKPLDLENDESFESDPEKLDYAKNLSELRDRWRRRLELEALERLAMHAETQEKDEPAPTDAELRERLRTRYAARLARMQKTGYRQHTERLLNAVAGAFDPHSTYMSPKRREDFDIGMSGSLEGIGAVLTVDGHYIKILRIVRGSASWRQGELEAGDRILAVAQKGAEPVDVADMPLDDAVRMIRGKKGTVVELSVQKPDGRKTRIAIRRDVVRIEATYAMGGLLRPARAPDAPAVGYIELPGFYGNTRGSGSAGPDRRCGADVKKLLDQLHKAGARSLILDLRGNSGGLLDEARKITGLFIDKGPVVQIRVGSKTLHTLRDDDAGTVFDGPMVVLVDRFSASAAEIVASALQDYGRAVIVGAPHTHGKGTVQILQDLDELMKRSAGLDRLRPLGLMKLTHQQYFRITGGSVQREGVTPDIELPDPVAYLESGEKHLPNALPAGKTDAASFEPWPHRTDLRLLRKASRARVAASDTFAKVDKQSQLYRQRRERTQESLQRDVFLAGVRKESEALKAIAGDTRDEPARLGFQPLEYAPAPPVPPREIRKPAPDHAKHEAKNQDAHDTVDRRLRRVTRDPWLEEAMKILGDMRPTAP